VFCTFLSFCLFLGFGAVGLTLGLLPNFLVNLIVIVVTVIQHSLQHFTLPDHAGAISEQISFIVGSLMYKIANPFPSLNSSWLTLACRQTFAMMLGVLVLMSKRDYDDLYLQFIFAGVVLGGLTFNKPIDWQIVLALSNPMIPFFMNLYKQYDDAAFGILQTIGILIISGFAVSFLPKPLNEIDYFIVDVFMGYSGFKLYRQI